MIANQKVLLDVQNLKEIFEQKNKSDAEKE